jgi:predicted Zn-dependent peptidase
VRATGFGVLLLVLGASILPAQDMLTFERGVTEFTLPNGMRFILVERHDTATIAFHTYIKVGTADDPSGQTGLANLVSRVMIKGTETLGTRNWEQENRAIQAAEQSYQLLQEERNKGAKADPGKIGILDTQWRMVLSAAQQFVDPGAYSRVILENGGTNLTVKALPDSTQYGYTLPSNKQELWFLLESQRLMHPVFRELYHERDQVMEDHRTNVDGKPLPRVEAALLATAFEAHPYRNPVDGWPSDVSNLGKAEVEAFFAKYYVPENIVIAIVGDVYPSGASLLAEKYFSPIPARTAPPRIHTVEPPQQGMKTAVVGASPQGLMAIGYKRPNGHGGDDAVLDVIHILLSGRAGALQSELVEKGIAQVATTNASFPGEREPNLFLFLISPGAGHTLDETQRALNTVIGLLQTSLVKPEAMERAKAQIRMNAMRRIESNEDLAGILSTYIGETGDWRNLFRDLDASSKVTAEIVQRVAARYFTTTNRTVAYLATEGRSDALPGRTGGQQ